MTYTGLARQIDKSAERAFKALQEPRTLQTNFIVDNSTPASGVIAKDLGNNQFSVNLSNGNTTTATATYRVVRVGDPVTVIGGEIQ